MSITLVNPFNQLELKKSENAYADEQGNTFPIVNEVPRVVDDRNYTESFGFQWNKFAKTQIDRESNSTQSTTRFLAESMWSKEDVKDQNILEVGSGAGRFSSVILGHFDCNLYSIDYSNAVEANHKTNGHHKNFHLFQASIYDMPFKKASFDRVFCFGVLQHTPSFEDSVKSLIEMAKPGGEVTVDFYPINGWYTKLHAKYLLRPFTKNMSHQVLLQKIEKNIDWLIATTQFFNKVGIGRIFNRFLPVCDIKTTMPKQLTKEELREWCILDTFDMFSPAYDSPQRLETVVKWFKKYGMEITYADKVDYDKDMQATVVKGIKK